MEKKSKLQKILKRLAGSSDDAIHRPSVPIEQTRNQETRLGEVVDNPWRVQDEYENRDSI